MAMRKTVPEKEVEAPVDSNPTDATIPEIEEVNSKKPVSSISLDDIAAHAAEKSPEPNESAINRTAEKEKADQAAQEGEKKKRGPYNKRPQEELKHKRRGASPSTVVTGQTETQKQEASYESCYKAGGESVDALVTAAGGLLGPEWYWYPPQKKKIPHPQRPGEFLEIEFDERSRGMDAFGKLYAHYNWGQPSPLMGVALFCVAYAGIRLKNPEVKAKALSSFDKVKLYFTKNKMERDAIKRSKEVEEKIRKQDEDRNKNGSAH